MQLTTALYEELPTYLSCSTLLCLSSLSLFSGLPFGVGEPTGCPCNTEGMAQVVTSSLAIRRGTVKSEPILRQPAYPS